MSDDSDHWIDIIDLYRAEVLEYTKEWMVRRIGSVRHTWVDCLLVCTERCILFLSISNCQFCVVASGDPSLDRWAPPISQRGTTADENQRSDVSRETCFF